MKLKWWKNKRLGQQQKTQLCLLICMMRSLIQGTKQIKEHLDAQESCP